MQKSNLVSITYFIIDIQGSSKTGVARFRNFPFRVNNKMRDRNKVLLFVQEIVFPSEQMAIQLNFNIARKGLVRIQI